MRFLFPWVSRRSKEPPILEGRTKILLSSQTPGTYILHFKDIVESPMFHLEEFPGRGALANRFSQIMMERFGSIAIPTHFLERRNMREQLVKATSVFPFRVVVYNQAVGEFADRLGIAQHTPLERPVIEFHIKKRHLKDTLITSMHLDALNWARQYEIDYLYFCIARINDHLSGQCFSLGLKLLMMNLEFGRYDGAEEGAILLTDEVAPDNLLVQDEVSKQVLEIFSHSEDGFRFNPQNYLDISKRFGIIPSSVI